MKNANRLFETRSMCLELYIFGRILATGKVVGEVFSYTALADLPDEASLSHSENENAFPDSLRARVGVTQTPLAFPSD